MKAIVIFSVGINHPLFNTPVEAEIVPCTGYNKRCVSGTTVKAVHFPEDPEGLLIFDKQGNFISFKTSEAYDKKYEGWIDFIWSDKAQKWLSAFEFSDVQRLSDVYGIDITNKL